jgi:hypothetical protein
VALLIVVFQPVESASVVAARYSDCVQTGCEEEVAPAIGIRRRVELESLIACAREPRSVINRNKEIELVYDTNHADCIEKLHEEFYMLPKKKSKRTFFEEPILQYACRALTLKHYVSFIIILGFL